MPGRDGPENLRIFKRRIGFRPLKDVVGFFGSQPTEILNITRCAAGWGEVSVGF